MEKNKAILGIREKITFGFATHRREYGNKVYTGRNRNSKRL